MQPISKPAWAFPEGRREGNFIYNNGEKVGVVLTKENLDLIGFTEETEHLVIPDQVEVEGVEYPIVCLDDHLFLGNERLCSVEIDMSNWDLDGYKPVAVFRGCSLLQEVRISSRYSYCIPKEMFHGCESLWHVELAPGLKSVEERAFFGCCNLRYIDLSGAKSIGALAFATCTDLREVNIDGTVAKDAFNSCIKLNSVTIGPNGALGRGAFAGCEKLGLVSIAEGVTEILSIAFADCAALEQIILPSTLRRIENDAFSGCTGLRVIKFNGAELPFSPEGTDAEISFMGRKWWEYDQDLTNKERKFCEANPEIDRLQFEQKFRKTNINAPSLGDSDYFLCYRAAVDAVEGGSPYNPRHEKLYVQWMHDQVPSPQTQEDPRMQKQSQTGLFQQVKFI